MPRTSGPKITNEDDRKPVVVIDVKEANIKEAGEFIAKALTRAGLAPAKEGKEGGGFGGTTVAGTLRVYAE